ncbi:MAG: glycosyl transferase [Clostridiales bacterium]|jgi:cellulose synthase/poly-beta-1,6-N-acetylglucosamine synthase-like glycosyltransferase|nr:glycosyl transferase [Clostridiales bacterium]
MLGLENIPLLGNLIKIFTYAITFICLYYFTISMFGWKKRKEIPAEQFSPANRFAILVAAHNEEKVISSIIQNLKRLNYPKDMYEIFVIADNCTDQTAKISKENGAKVYERYDSVKRGKGYSLEWMFKRIFDMENEYDAVCVLDADNLVSTDFLMEMNKHMCLGHEVIQGYLDSKNPTDSWISAGNSISFWVSNRLFQLPRHYLGLSGVLGGTGFVTSIKVLKELGWGATCLTEDLEYSLKLVLKGKKVYWSHEAVIYDEKPLGLSQSWRQRKRWMQGHFDCSRRFLKDLFVKAIKDRDFAAFDMALYMFQPIVVVMSGLAFIASILNILTNLMNVDIVSTLTSIALLYLFVMFLILERKVTLKVLKYILLFPIYNLTWIPIVIQGFLDRNKRDWVHTLHTRALDIDEIEGLDKVG